MTRRPYTPRPPHCLVPISSLLLLGAWLASSQAQVQTAIRPDGTLGTAVTQTGSLYEITGGTRPGNGPNLFHSFDRFSVGKGDTASFTSEQTGIKNILSRVTGGQRSDIDGQLRTDGQLRSEGANLYLLNPAGVLFGPNASLDVSGSFHVSTADYLRLGDGGIFSANLSEKSTLTVAPPVAFGFLGANPAAIAVQGSSLAVPENATLSLVGGDLEMRGGLLRAPSGKIHLVSVASPGEIVPSLLGHAPRMDVAAFAKLGNLNLSDEALINAGGNGGGTVVIRSGRLMVDSSSVFASTTGPAAGPFRGDPGLGIDIQVTEDVVLDSAIIGTNVFTNVAAGVGSGGIRLRANHLDIRHGAELQSIVFLGSTGGKGGDIDVEAQNVLIRDDGLIRAVTGGAGDGGHVNIRTKSLELRDGGVIFAQAFGGTGNGGNITVNAERVHLSNSSTNNSSTGIKASTLSGATGKAGNVQVTADALQILGEGGAEISSFTRGAGQGGNIEVQAGRVSISGSSDPNVFNGIFATVFGSGHGGQLNLQASSLTLTNRASISAATFSGTGNGGDLNMTAHDIFIAGVSTSRSPGGVDFTGISTTTSTGEGGNIHITAANLHVTDKGDITAGTIGSGRSGNITLRVSDSLRLTNGGGISAFTSGTGAAGSIDVLANRVTLSGVNSTPIVARSGDRAIETVLPTNISTQTQLRGGKAGNIQIRATSLQVLDGASIDAQTFGAGQGGDLDIRADTIVISGTSTAGSDIPTVPHPIRSNISTATNRRFMGDAATGKAGEIRLQAGTLEVRDGGLINSGTTAPGSAGNITITTDRMTLVGDAGVTSTSTSSPNAGKAGNIAITARDMFQSDNSTVSTAAEQAEGGAVAITAGRIQLRNGSRVSARSAGAGDAGRLTLTATDTFLSENSTITTEATQADGGNIQVKAQSQVRLRNSEITATVGGGPETVGGNIAIDPESVVLEKSQIRANAFAGRGGNVQITAGVFLADPASQVSASSERGINGAVDIRAPIADLSGTVTPLPQQFAQTAALLRDRCAARLQEGNVSSLVERGRDGVPANPDGVLPSRLYKAHAESNRLPKTGRQAKRTTAPSQPGLSRDADGQPQIKDWPRLAGSPLAWEQECAGR